MPRAHHFGPDQGIVLAVPAGSVVVFSALTLHGSGDNITGQPRRALNLAFGQGPPPAEQEGRRAHANTTVPFLRGGEVVPTALQLRGKPGRGPARL
jgi:ectoine hydroxylase-related dioxygenase (phytanoyl-CoA dioxygenase family)